MRHIVIIGNGITGITAARTLRKQGNDRITIISGESAHFYSRTALMYIYMGHMTYEDTKPYEDWFWEKNRLELVQDWVEAIDTKDKSLQLRSGTSLGYDALIIATGSASNKFGWPGQDSTGVQGLYNLQDLESMETLSTDTRRAVIVGGGLIGVEMAEMFLSRGIQVSFLVREEAFWSAILPREEAELVGREIRRHGIDLRLSCELDKIIPDASGRVQAIRTKNGEEIACEFVGLTVGVHPNISWLKTSGIETDRGILVDHFFRTSHPDIYAGGDCAQFRDPLPGRRPVEQVWYTGKMHGEHIASTLNGTETPYNPGIWWNSAKFFDVEYQTYGMVLPDAPEGTERFYWESTDGSHCLRIDYRRDGRAVTGFHLFGLRGRHAVCEEWIASETSIDDVLENLGAMNFDPEFYTQYEEDVLTAAREQVPGFSGALKTRKGLNSSYLKRLLATVGGGA